MGINRISIAKDHRETDQICILVGRLVPENCAHHLVESFRDLDTDLRCVVVGDSAIIGGLSAVHQFARIGRHAMIGGMSGVEHDVIPYGLVMGDRARLSGVNIVGLKRHGYSRAEIQALQQVYKAIFLG